METRSSKVKGKPGWGGGVMKGTGYTTERSVGSGDEQYSRKKYESECGESASWSEVERSGGDLGGLRRDAGDLLSRCVWK